MRVSARLFALAFALFGVQVLISVGGSPVGNEPVGTVPGTAGMASFALAYDVVVALERVHVWGKIWS